LFSGFLVIGLQALTDALGQLLSVFLAESCRQTKMLIFPGKQVIEMISGA